MDPSEAEFSYFLAIQVWSEPGQPAVEPERGPDGGSEQVPPPGGQRH